MVVVGHGEVVEPDRVVALEPGADVRHRGLVVPRFDAHGRAVGGQADFAALDDQRAGLEHIPRQLEHRPAVGLRRVDGDVRVRPDAEVPLVLQAQHPRRPGAGDDGDFRQRVLAVEVGQGAALREFRRQPLQHLAAVVPAHQQGDNLGVGDERSAVGVVGAHRHSPRVAHQQVPFEADGPLQGVDEGLFAVRDRHDAAPALALGLAVEPLAAGHLVQEVPQRAVAGHRSRLAEHHLADIDGQVGVGVDVLGQRRHFGAHRGLVVRGAAVAVELDVREVRPRPLDGPHGLQRRRPVARHPELIAMNVHPVRQLHFVRAQGDFADDLPRRDVEAWHHVVEPGHAGFGQVRPLLPDLDAAGVDDLQRVAAGGVQQVAEEVAELLVLPGGDPVHDVVVVADEDVEALVDDRRVVELFVRVPRAEGRDGGVEHGRVPQAGVQVAGGERRRRAAERAGPRQRRAAHRGVVAAVFGPEFAGDVDLRPGDVGVHVDAAGHDDHPGQIEAADGRGRVGGRGDDLAALDPEVADFARDAVRGVVDGAAGEVNQCHAVKSTECSVAPPQAR